MMWLSTKRGALLALLCIIPLTLLFWISDLDIWAASLFYHPEALDPWYEGDLPLWAFMYQMGPVISISIALGSIFIIFLSGLKSSWNHYRVQASFILLCFVIGPGLLVNALFKDHWGRPRPAQVIQFEGAEPYVPPGLYNADGDGKSFPSGHSSVGFALVAFFFIWRKRHRYLASLAVVSALLMGSLLGAARMAAGAHFLSDVLWSMFITFLVSAGLYRLYQRKLEHPLPASQQSRKMGVLYSIIAFLVLSIGLFNWPVKIKQSHQIPYQNQTTIIVNSGRLILNTTPTQSSNELHIHIAVKGFGLPKSGLTLTQQRTPSELHLEIQEKGLLTEVEGTLSIHAPATILERIKTTPQRP